VQALALLLLQLLLLHPKDQQQHTFVLQQGAIPQSVLAGQLDTAQI
jgi:hypothetical protein